MKKIILFSIIGIAFLAVLLWFAKKNSQSPIEYTTQKPFIKTIIKKTVATGKIIPEREVLVKPQISGIIDDIYVEEGKPVKKGDLIATIRVVPNVQSLNSAKGAVKNLELKFENAKTTFKRNKELFNKEVISKQDFDNQSLIYHQARQDLENAKNDLQIIKKGSASGFGEVANTNIRATASGTILEIPVKIGDQVIESNNFNEGTTIASIANLNKMIFEGKVDEGDVSKLVKGTDLKVSIGAIEDIKFPAKLYFIAPKGSEENGAVQFKIKANITLNKKNFVRAGYSANADIIIGERDSTLAIKESLLQFDKKTEKPYVEIKTGKDKFKRIDLKTGLSDGVNIEVLKGIKKGDEIKVWNKAEKDDKAKKG